MLILLVVISAAMLSCCLVATLLALAFIIRTGRYPVESPEQVWPEVSIILTLRGADPGLGKTIEALLAQDYPKFHLHITIDSSSDPAWNIAHEAIDDHGQPNVHIEALRTPPATCSLFCGAIAQTLHELSEESSVVVFVDADLCVHSQLLKHLVAPFREPNVGLTFGNRWYRPNKTSWGAELRRV